MSHLAALAFLPLPVDVFFPLVHGEPVWGGRRSPTPADTQLPVPVASWDASVLSGSTSQVRKGRERMDFRWKNGLSFKACTYTGFCPLTQASCFPLVLDSTWLVPQIFKKDSPGHLCPALSLKMANSSSWVLCT